jgi:hypothetical protein
MDEADHAAAEYVMAVIAARCPEVADLVMPSIVLVAVMAVLTDLQERVTATEDRLAGGRRAGRDAA